MLPLEIVEADLSREEHQRAVLNLIDAYAGDPMGNGMPLTAEVRRDLIPGLRKHPTTLIFLVFHGDGAVGIAVCFLGFSTFAARSLVHIEDLAVLPEYRGQGVGRRLLSAVEVKARKIGCCKLTLQVQENNHRARKVYGRMGFTRTEYVEEAGGGLSLAKSLSVTELRV